MVAAWPAGEFTLRPDCKALPQALGKRLLDGPWHRNFDHVDELTLTGDRRRIMAGVILGNYPALPRCENTVIATLNPVDRREGDVARFPAQADRR